MDKELARIHDLARGIIKQQFDQERLLQKIKHPDFSDSRLKKIRKVMTQLDQNFSIYADAVDNALVKGGGADDIRSIVRGVEEAALEGLKLLEDDSVHHMIQSRTGGDTLIEAPGDRVRRVFRRLEDKYEMTFGNTTGPDGNLQAQYSLSNFSHKSDNRARGLELESGIGKNPDKSTTSHPRSTAGSSKNLTPAQLASDDALFEALDKNIGQQIADSKQGLITDTPRQTAIRQLDPTGKAYTSGATVEDVAKSRSLIQTPANKLNILDAYRSLTKIPGAKQLGALLPGVGVGLDLLDAADRTAKAQEPDANVLDKVQANIAQAGAVTAPIPEPVSQGINLFSGLVNTGIDLFRSGALRTRQIRGRSGAQKRR